jgi:splicing factor 3A subunit 3
MFFLAVATNLQASSQLPFFGIYHHFLSFQVLFWFKSPNMVLEEQRLLHEDIERLEQAIADRFLEEPRHIRERLNRDHQIANFLSRVHDQSKRLLDSYKTQDKERDDELQSFSTGDPFESFYNQYNEIRDFHKRYPNEPVENLERAYKRRVGIDGEPIPLEIDTLFTGEEGYGRFFDLTSLHRQYLNLPGVKGTRRVTYLQYLTSFDNFAPIKKADKMTDAYFQYLGALVDYLESFIKKVKPLDPLETLFASFDKEFEKEWEAGKVPGWEDTTAQNGDAQKEKATDGTSIWCDACEKEFTNPNVYQHHLTQKKHLRNLESKTSNGSSAAKSSVQKLKEKAVAEREFRIKKIAGALEVERSDTLVNVERRQGMTERERAAELEAFMAEQDGIVAPGGEGDSDSDGEEKIYNPLKLPIGWDGKPIPYWLYKLHGLGVEFSCEICGNFVYMGRRAFEKHFGEQRHVYGLKCLGVTNTTLFREITGIEDALNLWEKISKDKKVEKVHTDNVVQMEDAEGNVMPEKVYNDLRKQGLL